ncbi:MAG TPA: hypothetical protein VF404_00565 [Sphingomonas sp.]
MAMIIARAALAAAIVAGAAVALPATAQNAPENGVLVIYGNQKCPTDSSGREIVVCSRRGADEQYRIPKELRELQVTPENESWAARDQAVLDAGASGVGSCSTVGPGGASGCFAKQAAAAKREREARKEAQSNIP